MPQSNGKPSKKDYSATSVRLSSKSLPEAERRRLLREVKQAQEAEAAWQLEQGYPVGGQHQSP
jgi:hypothetical protein